jgi:hypothetical protein
MTMDVARSHSASVPVAIASRTVAVPVERRVPSAIENAVLQHLAPADLLRIIPSCSVSLCVTTKESFRVAPNRFELFSSVRVAQNRPGLLRRDSALLQIVTNRFELLPILSRYLHRFRCSESSRTTPNRRELLRMFKIVPSWPFLRLSCLCVPWVIDDAVLSVPRHGTSLRVAPK